MPPSDIAFPAQCHITLKMRVWLKNESCKTMGKAKSLQESTCCPGVLGNQLLTASNKSRISAWKPILNRVHYDLHMKIQSNHLNTKGLQPSNVISGPADRVHI
ncbi:hypothetical protein Droror1_Dr00010466 [Drosera rotundifolia]